MAQTLFASKTKLESHGLASHGERLRRIGNRKFINTKADEVPVLAISERIGELGRWRERYPLVACTENDAKVPQFNLTNPQDLTTLGMSRLMRLLPKGNLSANTYCSGGTVEKVIQEMIRLEMRNPLLSGIANFSGEHTQTLAGVKANMQAYFELITGISKAFPKDCPAFSTATISMKPSQFGTYMGKEELRELFPEIFSEGERWGNSDEALWTARFLFALNNITYLAQYAGGKVDIWIDMEDHRLTTFTAHILYPSLLEDFGNVGVIFQGNLVRTERDVDIVLASMPDVEHHFRTCKGVYFDKNIKVYLSDDDAVRARAFVELNRQMVQAPEKHWVRLLLASASMDRECQQDVLCAVREKDDDRFRFRMQVLKGCADEKLENFILNEARVPLDVYLIFGRMIFPYTTRRYRKSPRIKRQIEGQGNALERLMVKGAFKMFTAIYEMFYEGGEADNSMPELF